MNIESLRTEYLAQHRVATESDLEDEDIQIDVVGEDTDDEPEDCSLKGAKSPSPSRRPIGDGGDFLHQQHHHHQHHHQHQQTKQSQPRNPFSIESLLYNHS